jgi:hypothetical protein
VVVKAGGVLAIVIAAGCGASPPVVEDDEARALYPDLAALYGGDHGIYRGCAPNGGVCHNAREFPDLHTLGSIVDNIGRPCNAKRDRPEALHDLCERPGDALRIGDAALEIAWLEPAEGADPISPRAWRIHLREPVAAAPVAGDDLAIERDGAELFDLGEEPGVSAAIATDSAAVIELALPETPPGTENPEDPDFGTYVAGALVDAGRPNDPDSIQLGDSNRNGTFGAELGGRIIQPGDPARSYLMRRLLDPAAGPLMPRANCCFWTKAALRAMQCWIEGLRADGENALDPIDYDRCGPPPATELIYPDPGPACEAQGLCPVEALPGDGTDFGSIYRDILVQRCAGAGCHNQEPVGGVDFATERAAYDTLAARVVPGDPAASLLYQRLSPELCTGTCKTMPLGREPLIEEERARIAAWIEAGALSE